MGVPGFFKWLLKKYGRKNIVCSQIHTKVKILYLDANCLIHPQCRKVIIDQTLKMKESDSNISFNDFIEKKMLNEVITYIKHLVSFVQPDELYIAVDGVAPVAKIKQQRIRRFKSMRDKFIYDDLKKKYKKPLNHPWDTTAITPGTKFMNKLSNRIRKCIQENKFGNIKCYFSSSNIPGEGEHKILAHLKKLKDHPTCVIYGLDADLIFLALASKKKHLYLLREASQLKPPNHHTNTTMMDQVCEQNKIIIEELNYVDMDLVQECVYYCLTQIPEE